MTETLTLATPPAANLKRAKVIVYDNDDVLAYHTFATVSAVFGPYFREKVNQHLNPDRHLTAEQANLLTHQHFVNHGSSALGFALQFGFSEQWIEEARTEPQKLTGRWYVENQPRCDILPTRMAQLAEAGYVQAVLSAAHPDHAEPILAHNRVTDYVPANLRLNQLNAGGGDKRTEVPYIHMLEALEAHGIHPDELWMVEDSPPNLIPAKKLGFRTVLVGERATTAEEKACIDYTYPEKTGVLTFQQDLLDNRL